jgi:UDP-N-acetylmuramate dehydrogenase
MNLAKQLQEIFANRYSENEPMAKHTNFRIGGPAKWFVEVRNIQELTKAINIAVEAKVDHFIFGGGSNILVNDRGYDGLMIKMGMRAYEIQGETVRAEAGVLSSALARATANRGLKGFEWAISLPGTIGGAIRGNAGCHGGETGDHLEKVEVWRDGEIIELSNEELQFGYRESVIKHSGDIVISATFKLEEADADELKAQLDQFLMQRKRSQPFDGGSAGCMFKNYDIKDDEELQRLTQKFDIPPEMSKSRRLSAGWLIDQLDLKGVHIGGAKISEVHGNFLMNTGEATADHVLQLISLIKTRAKDEYGILLEEEVNYVGF